MLPEPMLKWKSWPFVERPWTSIILVIFLILLSLLLYRITVFGWQQPFYYFLGMILVLGNLLPYFIVTEYELYEDKVQVRYLFIKFSRPYTDFGCFYEDKHGIMLSTFKMPRRLDPFRGLSLRFSSDKKEREKLLEILMQKIGKKY